MLKKRFSERKKEGRLKSASKEIGGEILGEIAEGILSLIFRGIVRVLKHLF